MASGSSLAVRHRRVGDRQSLEGGEHDTEAPSRRPQDEQRMIMGRDMLN
jgi:hypothetical protein